MAGYLCVPFTGEHKDGEQVYFSVSQDGLYFTDLNKGSPVLYSNIGEKGIQDPFLVHDHRQQKFYIIATDLRMEKGLGWQHAQDNGSRDIIIWESTDLISWSGPWNVTVGIPSAGNVWAPEAFYDKEKDAFMVFWASKVDGKHRMYAAYTNDFITFDEPFVFIDQINDVIDTTITYDDGVYYRFTKNEENKRTIMESSDALTGVYHRVEAKVLEALTGIEGPEIYRLPDGETWCLIVDQFMENKGYLPLISKDLAAGSFEILPPDHYHLGENKKRHRGVLKITDQDYQRLLSHYK